MAKTYYDVHAEEFAKMAKNVDFVKMNRLYMAVGRKLPKHATIVDLGCGEGRDAEYFGFEGHKVIGIDKCQALIDIANARKTRNVRFYCEDFLKSRTFNSLADESVDLIWSCAGFVHCQWGELQEMIAKSHQKLKKGGQLFLSFKNEPDFWKSVGNMRLNLDSDGNPEEPPRYYLDMGVRQCFSLITGLNRNLQFDGIETWISDSAKNTEREVPADKLQERKDEQWFNIILTK